jgi:hypothetical protein
MLEHYFASESFYALRDAFSSAYPDTEVMKNTALHQLVKVSGHWKCLSERNVYRATQHGKLRPYLFKAVHQLQRQLTAGCENSLLLSISSF